MLGIAQFYTPVGYFFPLLDLDFLRRSPFSYRVIPSLGTYDDQAQEEQKLDDIPCATPDEVQEKETLKGLLS